MVSAIILPQRGIRAYQEDSAEWATGKVVDDGLDKFFIRRAE
jgi:hypothetical protein